MKQALLISDSHNQNEEMLALVEHFSDVDAIFHMGDIGNAGPLLTSKARCLTYVVRGNTDHDYELPDHVAIDFAGKRVVATHGHRYLDYDVSDSLRYFGEENHADVLLFGHIHRPVLMICTRNTTNGQMSMHEVKSGSGVIRTESGMLICNPGSISRPRQRDRKCTFAILRVDGDAVTIQHYACSVDLHDILTVEEYQIET